MHHKQRYVVEFELFKSDGEPVCVSALTLPTSCRVLSSLIDLTPYDEFASLNLASDSSLDDKPIDILIGSRNGRPCRY